MKSIKNSFVAGIFAESDFYQLTLRWRHIRPRIRHHILQQSPQLFSVVFG